MGCCQSRENPPTKNNKAIDRTSLVCHVKGTPRDNFRTIKVLGKGGFGTVTLVEDKRTGAKRAMKELLKSGLTEADRATMLREVTTLSTIDHPNIMKVYELIESNTAYNIVNAVRRDLEGDLKRTNVLLMDAGIRHCLQAGLVFDFEGSMLPGVEDFYRTMGGRQTPTYRMQRSRSLVMHLLRSGQILRRERSGGRT